MAEKRELVLCVEPRKFIFGVITTAPLVPPESQAACVDKNTRREHSDPADEPTSRREHFRFSGKQPRGLLCYFVRHSPCHRPSTSSPADPPLLINRPRSLSSPARWWHSFLSPATCTCSARLLGRLWKHQHPHHYHHPPLDLPHRAHRHHHRHTGIIILTLTYTATSDTALGSARHWGCFE